jgi:lipopolysaccharide export system permease protein
LFLGLLMTLGKLYTESEITVMHACGLSKAVLVKAAMILALFTGAVAAVNVMWAGPWSSRHQDEVLAEAKANPGMAALAQGQFQQASDGNAVLFIESVNGNRFMTSSLPSCVRKATRAFRGGGGFRRAVAAERRFAGGDAEQGHPL